MTQNIEQRTEVAVSKYEKASNVVDQLGNTDSEVETPAGKRDSFPKLSRVFREEQDLSQNQMKVEHEVSQLKRQEEFQNSFALSQLAISWQSGLVVSDVLQRYKVGNVGSDGYKEFLPNPDKVPFSTGSSIDDDFANSLWLENGVPNKAYVENLAGLPWVPGYLVTDPTKIYRYQYSNRLPIYVYAPNASNENPITMGASPVDDDNFLESNPETEFKIAQVPEAIRRSFKDRFLDGGVSLKNFGLKFDGTDETELFNKAVKVAVTLGIHILTLPKGSCVAAVEVDAPLQFIGEGEGATELTYNGDKPTVYIGKSDFTRGAKFSDMTIGHTGTSRSHIINGRENTFERIKFTGPGGTLKNNILGSVFNRYNFCNFYRNEASSLIIPENQLYDDTSPDYGYANSTIMTGCNWERFADGTPIIKCGTSLSLVGGFMQGRDYAGIQVTSPLAVIRAGSGFRIDSTSSSHVLVHFINGSDESNVNFSSVDIDGYYEVDGGNKKHANTLVGSMITIVKNDEVVKKFKSAEHELTDLGGTRGNGVKIGDNRVFWSSDIPSATFPNRTHLRGDVAYKSNPGSVANESWICIASGVPGTWVGFPRTVTGMDDSTATDVNQLTAEFNKLLGKLRAANVLSS